MAALISVFLTVSQTIVCSARPQHTVPAYAPIYTNCVYPGRDGQAELAWVAGYILRSKMVYPSADGHPSK